MRRVTLPAACLAALAAALALAAATPPVGGDLPDIVFALRRPLHGGIVPGLGVPGRTAAAGGRLMVREGSGRVRALRLSRRFFDVADPAVSYDGGTLAFAGLAHPDSNWRIWIAGVDGRRLRPLTRSLPPGRGGRDGPYDDFDPCWLPNGRVCFASTRWNMTTEAGVPASNLYVIDTLGGSRWRITNEHNGAEEPAVDPASGRIVLARRWASRYLASDATPSGVTVDPSYALPGERVDLWQAVSITPDGDGMRLAGGNARRRIELSAYQPLLLADSTLVGIVAEPPSLDTAAPPRVVVYPRGFAAAQPLVAGGAACAPAALPDGRLLFAHAEAGEKEFAIHVIDGKGAGPQRLAGQRGWHALDPVAVVARPQPETYGDLLGALPRPEPAASQEDLDDLRVAMRFDCLNVFANAPVDWPIPDAPPLARDVRIRFFIALARPDEAGGDSLVLLRESRLTRSGAVHEDVTPGDVPMFEQLVGADGKVLLTSSGPAHVPGFNVGRTGTGTHCVGCHTGHSAIPVPNSYALGKRFNGATSAVVTASGELAGAHARSVIDRRTRGDAGEVAWLAPKGAEAWIELAWSFPLAIDSLYLYGVRPEPGAGTDLVVEGADIQLSRDGRIVRRTSVLARLAADGTGADCGGVVADRVLIRLGASRGGVRGRPASGLAEIEAQLRIPED